MESTVQSEPSEREVARRTIGIEVVGDELRPLVDDRARLAVVTRAPEQLWVHVTDRYHHDADGPLGPASLLSQLLDDCVGWAYEGAEVLPPGLDVIEALWGQPVTGARSAAAEMEELKQRFLAELGGPMVVLPVQVPDAERVAAAIRAFRFWNYGMDDVDPNSEYAEWVPALAADIVASFVPESAAAVPVEGGPAAAYTARLTLHVDQLDVPGAGPRWQILDARDEQTWHDVTGLTECEDHRYPIGDDEDETPCVVVISTAYVEGEAHWPSDSTIDVRIPAEAPAVTA